MMYIILSKKKLISCLVAGFLLCAFCVFSYADTFFDDRTLTVIIDAGHGLPDGGAVGTSGVIEQDINLKIAKKAEDVLTAKNINVIMTRTDENGIWDKDAESIREKKRSDMNNRLKIMKKSNADLFISIHMNSFPATSTSGLRIFYSKNSPEIKELAEHIQSRMCDVTGAKTSVIKTADTSLFLMKNPPVPAILVECGFLSNAEEEKRLETDDYQSRLAWALADAIEKYYATGENQPKVDIF